MARVKKTQDQKILGFLGTGKELTVTTAKNRFGINHLNKRIYDLRQEGWTIYTNKKTVKGGKVTAYRLRTVEQPDAQDFASGNV